MTTKIRIVAGDLVLAGELHDGPLASAVAQSLPLETEGRLFGSSFYLETAVDLDIDEACTDAVAIGDIAYWPPALALAFFYGPTPETPPGSEEPVAASEVEVIGRFEGAEQLRGREAFPVVRVERAE